MPVSSKKLVYDFNRKYDAQISGKKRNIPLVDVISYLNEAQEIWQRAVIKLAETDERIRQDLRQLEIKNYCTDCQDFSDGVCVSSFPKDLFKKLNQRATVVNKECCGDLEKELVIKINQSDDINETKRHPYLRASFPWERLNADEGSGGLYVYHQNEMEIKSVCIDYYRRLKPIHAPSLIECEGPGYYDYNGVNITEDSDFEIDGRFIDNTISDIAVLLAKRDAGEVNDFQVRLQALVQMENIIKQ